MTKKHWIGFDEIKNEDSLAAAGRAFDKDGGYPLGMSDCYVVGINGSCGLECPVFTRGDCGESQEFDRQDIIYALGEDDAQEIFDQYSCFDEVLQLPDVSERTDNG